MPAQKKAGAVRRNFMTLQNFLLFFVYCFPFVVNGQTFQGNNLTNPTGIYRTHFNNPKGKILPQGTIKMKMIGQNRIVISLIMQNGEPLLRSGQLMDTLLYKNHFAVFKNAEIDSTCKITFRFTSKGIEVRQASKFANMSCDFADGVNADGLYIKESTKVPDFHNPY